VEFRQIPTLVVNPGDDEPFRAEVYQAVTTGVTTPESLVLHLRAKYPKVVVRRRELSAETHEVWYVYREGSWRSTAASNHARDDFRAASESLVADAERLREIELRSARMEESDPELDALARESEELTRNMARKSAHQAELIRQAREGREAREGRQER
jgi:hypothetical protein